MLSRVYDVDFDVVCMFSFDKTLSEVDFSTENSVTMIGGHSLMYQVLSSTSKHVEHI